MKQSSSLTPLALVIFISVSMLCPAFAGDVGKAEYEKTCIACHASATRLVKKITGADNLKKQEFLEKFLVTHHAPDADIRQAIISYLLSI